MIKTHPRGRIDKMWKICIADAQKTVAVELFLTRVA